MNPFILFSVLAVLVTVVLFFFFRPVFKSLFRAPPSRSGEESPVVPAEISVATTPTAGKFSKALKAWIPLLNSKSREAQQWEPVLIGSDLGPKLTSVLVEGITKSEQEPLPYLKNTLSEWLEGAELTSEPWRNIKPWVCFFVGVNGVGKTTSLVKIATFFKNQGLKVGVVGADTFRKAAVEQLQRGCEKVGVDFFTMPGKSDESEGADPSAVIFDGLKKWGTTHEIILVDTSGRLHTKKNLMEELKKMRRVADKALPGSPHDVWMIIDATQGQNATLQAKEFHSAMTLTGLVLSKMDGLSRGGTVFQLFQELKVGIRFLGVGESPQDLEIFEKSKFIQDLFDQREANS